METFYVIGSVLAVWALLVSFLGITRKTFPGSGMGERAVGLVTAVLVVAAVSTAVIGAANESESDHGEREGGHDSPGLSR